MWFRSGVYVKGWGILVDDGFIVVIRAIFFVFFFWREVVGFSYIRRCVLFVYGEVIVCFVFSCECCVGGF